MSFNFQVRQPRLHILGDTTFRSPMHGLFVDYLDRKNYEDTDRAYILDVGQGLVESVNDKFSRMSFPFNKSIDGYGTFVLPKEQIMISGNKNLFGEAMYDVDLGDKYKKHKVTYVDKQNQRCEEYISTKYIERYLNFTASAYHDGWSNSRSTDYLANYDIRSKTDDTLLCDMIQKGMDSNSSFRAYNCKRNYKRNDSKPYYSKEDFEFFNEVKDKFSKFCKSGKFDYNAFRKEYFSKVEDLYNVNMFMNDKTFDGLSSSNKMLYVRSYMEGVIDESKRNVQFCLHVVYPPEKGSDEESFAKTLYDYNDKSADEFFIDGLKSVSGLTSCSSIYEYTAQLFDENPNFDEDLQVSASAFMDLDDDDYLPFN